MAIIQKELNVIQGFGERQILRNTEATVTYGMLVELEATTDEFILPTDPDSGNLLCVAQNNSANKDAQGTAADFVGPDAQVIGIPVSSGAEVELPAALVTIVVANIGAPLYASTAGAYTLTSTEATRVGFVTGVTDNGTTVLLG